MAAAREGQPLPERERHPEGDTERAGETEPSLPEDPAQIVERADDAVHQLQETGEKMTSRVAAQFEANVDPETSAALDSIVTEAKEAEEALKQELETTETAPEKGRDFSRLAGDLDEAVSAFVGPDGALDETAFSQASPEAQERVRAALASLQEAYRTDPAAFLSSPDALQSIRVDELRKEFMNGAAEELASDDPDRALAAYQNALGEESMDEASLLEKRQSFNRQYVMAESRRIETQAESDPIAAANRMLRFERRTREIGVDGPRASTERLAEKVRASFREALASGADGVALFRSLDDGAPGDRGVAWDLVDKALNDAPGDDWQQKKQAAIDALGQRAPDALLVQATGQYSSQGWTPEERLQLTEAIARLPESKRSVLAELSLSGNDLPKDKDMSPEARRALFDAYRANKPENVVEHAEAFPAEIAAMPEKERTQMIDATIARDPYAVVRQADGWRNVLSEGQRKNMLLSMAKKGELRLEKDAFLLKKMPELAQSFTPDVVDKVMLMQPDAVLTAADQGGITLDAGQRTELLLSMADKNQLYDKKIEQLQRIGALTPEAIDTVIDRQPKLLLFNIANGAIEVSEAQAKTAIAKSLEAGGMHRNTVEQIERIVSERDLQFAEDDVWKMVDAGMAGGDLTNPDLLGALKRLAESAEAGPRLTKLVNAAERIATSPSASLRRLSRELLGTLRSAEDPEAAFTQVEGIFERNQLPLVGKVNKVFEVLYPKEKLDALTSAEHCSPTLRAESHRGRMLTIYKDLVSIHLDSGNPSLRGYMETLRDGQGLMDKVDAEGLDSLSEDERKSFESTVEKIKRLHETSLAGRIRDDQPASGKKDVADVYGNLRQSLSAKEGQSLSGRVAEMYLKPLGLETIESALERMDASGVKADRRNREWVAGGSGRIDVKAGDLLKGFNDRFLRNILENGSVAKEFLGASADSDRTPLDTDVARILPGDADAGLAGALAASPVGEYGDLFMVVRDRGQFQETSAKDDPAALNKEARKREARLELFPTGVVGERHFGVRTGLPSTEIDAIGVTERLMREPKRLDSRIMDVVANGHYVPMVDQEGNILVTPEKFDDYRQRFFGGTEGMPFRMKESSLENAPAHADALREVMEAKRKERASVQGMNAELRGAVLGELAAQGIESSAGFDELLTNAEIYDTGSSSRGTNVPGSYDFDFIVKLNAADMAKAASLNESLVARLGGKKHEGHRPDQLRLLGAKLGSETADVDVGFADKSEVAQYESHDAVSDRLDAIRRDLGDEAHERVVANIVLAKKLLKEAGAYKKFEDGGIGGIGVENWVLSEGGSALTAMESFEQAAFDGETLRPLAEFQQEYKVLDPGINAKTGGHDNFISLLKGDGYAKMAQAVRGYLKKARTTS